MDGEQEIGADLSSRLRIFVRPMASALPLGFFAFAVGTVLLSAVELKWIPPGESKIVAALVLAYVAPLELLAAIFAFLSRDTGTGTTMAIFGAGWIALALQYLLLGTEATTTAMGVFMIQDSLAILALGVVSFSAKPMMAGILFFAAVRFLLSACVQFGAGSVLGIAAAAIGLLVGLLAVYGGLALLLEDIKQKAVLPVFRRKDAQRSIEGSLDEQLSRVLHEAGVRQQL